MVIDMNPFPLKYLILDHRKFRLVFFLWIGNVNAIQCQFHLNPPVAGGPVKSHGGMMSRCPKRQLTCLGPHYRFTDDTRRKANDERFTEHPEEDWPGER